MIISPKGHRDKWLQSPLTDNQKKKPYGVISAMLYLCNAVYSDNQIKDYPKLHNKSDFAVLFVQNNVINNQFALFIQIFFQFVWRNGRKVITLQHQTIKREAQ